MDFEYPVHVPVLVLLRYVQGNNRELGMFRNELRNETKTVKFYALLRSALARTQKRTKKDRFAFTLRSVHHMLETCRAS